MYAIYILGLMLGIAMYLVSGSEDKQAEISEGNIVSYATQLLAYHDYADEYCRLPANCNAAAEITSANVTSVMPSVMAGATSYNDGRFRSYTNGSGLIVTISMDHNFYSASNVVTNHGTAKMINERSQISSKLMQISGASRVSGPYDRASQTVTGYDGTVVSVPNTLAGMSFRDDVPMVVDSD